MVSLCILTYISLMIINSDHIFMGFFVNQMFGEGSVQIFAHLNFLGLCHIQLFSYSTCTTNN